MRMGGNHAKHARSPPPPRKRVYYSLEDPPDGARRVVNECLNDPRGWHGQGWTFLVRGLKNQSRWKPFVHVRWWTNQQIVGWYGPEFDGLSVCDRMDGAVTYITFNKENWDNPPGHFASTQDYHEYIIQHEFGHAIGLDHPELVGRGMCNPMDQQTRRPPCTANAWQKPGCGVQ